MEHLELGHEASLPVTVVCNTSNRNQKRLTCAASDSATTAALGASFQLCRRHCAVDQASFESPLAVALGSALQRSLQLNWSPCLVGRHAPLGP